MTPRDAIGELERMGFVFTLLSGAVVRYRRLPSSPDQPMGAPTADLDDAVRGRAQKLLGYLAAHKPGLISVLERRDHGAASGDVVMIEQIHEYLKAHGYRVVRATWPEHEPRPLLIVEDECPSA